MNNFFEKYPEFVESDSRKVRGWNPVTVDTLNKRHEVCAPKWLVEDHSVLDLGSCLGATGHWVLSNGARDYTGVEVQEQMATTSQKLLSKHWSPNQFTIVNKDIRSFLKQEIEYGHKYDVIFAMGVTYAFLNTYELLEDITKLCKYAVVFDNIYPNCMISPDVSIIDFHREQHINSSTAGVAYHGAGARVSPNALRVMMESFGFQDKEGLLYPKKLEDDNVHNAWLSIVRRPSQSYPLPSRYIMRLYNMEHITVRQVADNVINSNQKSTAKMIDNPTIEKQWEFNEDVANTFYREAEVHIPDYHRVISLCADVTKQVYGKNKEIKIIDVGSAIGTTVEFMKHKGYPNSYGVECSASMISKSVYKENIIHSDQFPEGDWNVVMANWTLHFIHERKEYLQSIYNNMSGNGILLLTDKMDHTVEIEELYHKMKLDNGATREEVERKKASLVGVLTTKPLTWYIETLRNIGFVNIQVINSKYMFNTIYARKL